MPDYSVRLNVVTDNWLFLVSGVNATLGVTAAALALGVVLGLPLGMARLSARRYLFAPAVGYIEVFRNTPALVQLIWIYNCLPILTGINLSAVASCTVALGLNAAAYIAEIFRAGIQSIDRGQVDAARSLGMSYLQAMRKVVLPQAFRRMIPAFVNETVSLLKYSSLVSVLGVADLTYQAQALSTTTYRPIEVFTFVAFLYFVLCTLLSYFARRLELRLAVSD
jgi:His/Glu/Gln/Arg/opine family amino acid ABC transporter permease subunit